MKLTTLILPLCALLVLASCAPGGSSDGNQADSNEAENGEAQGLVTDVTIPTEGENYTIKVVDAEPASPRKEMTCSIGETTVTVNYGSPSVKGRVIWGGLEQYGKVWRAGANQATSITFSSDVMIGNQPLAAGTYAFFTIPTEEDWTIIFNTVSDQWGAYDHDPEKDVLRAQVSPRMEESNQETLEYFAEGDEVVMRWEKIALPIGVASTPAAQ